MRTCAGHPHILRWRSSTFERLTSEVMVLIIDVHREVYGVEPICRVLPIAPSANHLTGHFFSILGSALRLDRIGIKSDYKRVLAGCVPWARW